MVAMLALPWTGLAHCCHGFVDWHLRPLEPGAGASEESTVAARAQFRQLYVVLRSH